MVQSMQIQTVAHIAVALSNSQTRDQFLANYNLLASSHSMFLLHSMMKHIKQTKLFTNVSSKLFISIITWIWFHRIRKLLIVILVFYNFVKYAIVTEWSGCDRFHFRSNSLYSDLTMGNGIVSHSFTQQVLHFIVDRLSKNLRGTLYWPSFSLSSREFKKV